MFNPLNVSFVSLDRGGLRDALRSCTPMTWPSSGVRATGTASTSPSTRPRSAASCCSARARASGDGGHGVNQEARHPRRGWYHGRTPCQRLASPDIKGSKRGPPATSTGRRSPHRLPERRGHLLGVCGCARPVGSPLGRRAPASGLLRPRPFHQFRHRDLGAEVHHAQLPVVLQALLPGEALDVEDRVDAHRVRVRPDAAADDNQLAPQPFLHRGRSLRTVTAADTPASTHGAPRPGPRCVSPSRTPRRR